MAGILSELHPAHSLFYSLSASVSNSSDHLILIQVFRPFTLSHSLSVPTICLLLVHVSLVSCLSLPVIIIIFFNKYHCILSVAACELGKKPVHLTGGACEQSVCMAEPKVSQQTIAASHCLCQLALLQYCVLVPRVLK